VIGNDIVDLSAVQCTSRSLDDRFLDKICSEKEQEIIRHSSRPEEKLWRLWSMKESAYKIFVRKHKRLFYNPLKFQCQVIDQDKGLVTIDDEYYNTFSDKTKKFIHTIAHENTADSFVFDFTKLKEATYEDQHRYGYGKLLAIYAKNTGISIKDLDIHKDNLGIPALYIHNRKTNLAFSISHHGHYAAVAMLTS
jgi:phosphopantetheinyl transferase (holo-ACP synthase)